MIETFLINFVLAPLTQWCGNDGGQQDTDVAAAPTSTEGNGSAEGKWIPQRAPIPPTDLMLPSPTRTTSEDEFFTPKSQAPTGSPKHEPMMSLTPDSRPKNP